MGKDYDYYITPQNTSRLKQKKCLYLMVTSVFVLLSLLITLLSAEQRLIGVLGMVLGVLWVISQMLDRRKEQWTWWRIILECAAMCYVSGMGIVLSKLYWCFVLWIAAVIACIALAIYDRYKKRKRK